MSTSMSSNAKHRRNGERFDMERIVAMVNVLQKNAIEKY